MAEIALLLVVVLTAVLSVTALLRGAFKKPVPENQYMVMGIVYAVMFILAVIANILVLAIFGGIAAAIILVGVFFGLHK